LPIGDRIERFDGLRLRPGVELHRPAGTMDARRPPNGRPIGRRRARVRLAAREARDLGDPADELSPIRQLQLTTFNGENWQPIGDVLSD
jgi:hypothetical protein